MRHNKLQQSWLQWKKCEWGSKLKRYKGMNPNNQLHLSGTPHSMRGNTRNVYFFGSEMFHFGLILSIRNSSRRWQGIETAAGNWWDKDKLWFLHYVSGRMLYGDHEATTRTPKWTGLVALNLSHVILKRVAILCCCACHRMYIYQKKSQQNLDCIFPLNLCFRHYTIFGVWTVPWTFLECSMFSLTEYMEQTPAYLKRKWI